MHANTEIGLLVLSPFADLRAPPPLYFSGLEIVRPTRHTRMLLIFISFEFHTYLLYGALQFGKVATGVKSC